MKMNHVPSAKIISHDEGMGVPSTDMVRQRALEIAQIDGRSASNEKDWQQAKIELHGDVVPTGDDDGEMMDSFSERDMVMGSMGHHTENSALEDSGNIVEELVSEGMEEAVHDQMLEASKLEDGKA
jgi:hypothetical protein